MLLDYSWSLKKIIFHEFVNYHLVVAYVIWSDDYNNSLDSEGERPTPLRLEPSSLPIDVLRSLPRVGSVLRITAGKSFKEIQQQAFGSHWFKFRKITCANDSGIWKGMLQSLSKVSVLSDEDETVLLRERYIFFFLYQLWPCCPWSISHECTRPILMITVFVLWYPIWDYFGVYHMDVMNGGDSR